jgi:hypothetical protein
MDLQIPSARYCPTCNEYTAWKKTCTNLSICINDKHPDTSDHPSYLNEYGAYWSDLGDQPAWVARLMDAMSKEVDAGTFEPTLWAPSFPAEVDEAIAKISNNARKCLDEKMPPPLVEIVMRYLQVY